jgi:Zn-dependent protease
MSDKLYEIMIHALVLFTAFPVHECAHALTAHWLGDDTAKNQGRITLNPFAHLDIMGTVMMIFVGFGWAKPVPVYPGNFRNRKLGMAITSLAGPVSNLLMAYVAMTVYKILAYIGYGSNAQNISIVSDIFWYITLLNLGLAVFNLLPIPPLDGSKIFNAILPDELYFKIMRYENIIFFALIALVFLGILDGPISFLQMVSYKVMDFLTGWIDVIMSIIT